MTFVYPGLLLIALVVTAAAVTAYTMLQRWRSAELRATGLSLTATGTRGAVRRHLPYVLFLVALPLLLVGLARPQAELALPRAAGTVILVLDVSASMGADDVEPTRLKAAQTAAAAFVDEQPQTVDIGVVIFGQDGLTTQEPTKDHNAALSAIDRASPTGGTSLTRAILAALTAIVGKPVALPESGGTDQPADLGYWGSATIVLFSDGQDTSGTNAESAATLAADAGVRIETVGVGTTRGTTVEVDGYQVATALDEQTLMALSAITGGSYHPAQDAAALNDIHNTVDLRVTTQTENVELTGPFAGVALLLLTLGGLLMIAWYGRIV
ncbi:MAG: VWA domain-containing protein [Hamadaea sp.]|nr:VWA domain-containing protein [Hamadaea sp.]